jgi:uncharacterized protein (DUF1330 family)
MSIYLIFENEIHDEEAYERYKAAVKPMVEAAGGEYLTLDAFSSSEEYQPWKKLRESVTTTKTLIRVEGIEHGA